MYPRRGLTAQLACVRHAASVHSEPGSNSPVENVEHHVNDAVVISKRVLITRTRSDSVARSEDQMTEVRWFLSIQFSKSHVPWRVYQSRALGAPCHALFSASTGARTPTPNDVGSVTIRKERPAVNPSSEVFFGATSKNPNTGSPRGESQRALRGRKKEGGRVPRQGRHVLDGTLDRLEGASFSGP